MVWSTWGKTEIVDIGDRGVHDKRETVRVVRVPGEDRISEALEPRFANRITGCPPLKAGIVASVNVLNHTGSWMHLFRRKPIEISVSQRTSQRDRTSKRILSI